MSRSEVGSQPLYSYDAYVLFFFFLSVVHACLPFPLMKIRSPRLQRRCPLSFVFLLSRSVVQVVQLYMSLCFFFTLRLHVYSFEFEPTVWLTYVRILSLSLAMPRSDPKNDPLSRVHLYRLLCNKFAFRLMPE